MHIISPTSDLLDLKFSEKGQQSGFWGAFQAILTQGQVWESLNWLFYEVPSSSNLCGFVNWNYAPRKLNIFHISDTDSNKYWFQQEPLKANRSSFMLGIWKPLGINCGRLLWQVSFNSDDEYQAAFWDKLSSKVQFTGSSSWLIFALSL